MDKSIPLDVQKRVQSWLDGPFDAETKKTISDLLKNNPEEIKKAFFEDLSFGTGGMRGIMGVGTNRINIYTIQMATQGLANYLNEHVKNPSVFIGYDMRENSRLFAEECAKVLSGNQIKPFLSKDVCPTPLASFACRYFKASAAIMITASHNPPEYNGYKVYFSDGAQITSPHDQKIIEEVRKIRSPAQVKKKEGFVEVKDEIDLAYLKELEKARFSKEKNLPPLHILYTNLHGTGVRLMEKALNSWGFSSLTFVEEQKALDPQFSNAPSPNPEEKKALDLGVKQFEKVKADLFLATDPDADRIAVFASNTYFTGQEIAALLLHYICDTLQKQNELPQNGACIKSIVTTSLLEKIAKSFSIECFDVLTGFKYIAEKMALWEKDHSHQFLFGAEESLGYLFPSFVRDKDAFSSACLIAEMSAHLKKQGKTLLDQLHFLYELYGVHKQKLIGLKFQDGPSGIDQMNTLMKNLREKPPQKIGEKSVVKTIDYLEKQNDLPTSNVLQFLLEDGWVIIRPSGTEPKVKVYLELVGKKKETISTVEERLKALEKAVQGLLPN